MWRLAYRQLTHEWPKTALTALAISGAIAVILIFRGFEQGLYIQAENVVLHRGGQLIATQAGVANFFVVRSSLPQLTRRGVEKVDGVKEAYPVTGLWVIYGDETKKTPLYLMVHDHPKFGGPTHIVAGNANLEGHGIVVDRGLSKKIGLSIGETITISDFKFKITGITESDSALFSPMAFVSYDTMIDFFLESEVAPDISTFPLLSFLLIELKPGADLMEVKKSIEASVPEVDVFTPQELAKNDKSVGKELFGPIMGLLVGISYVISLLVIGLIIYSDVSGRLRHFGVMKALGFRISQIRYNVIFQSLLLVVISFPFGVLLAQAAASLIEFNMPVYLVPIVETAGLLKVLIGLIVITFFSSLMPLRLITKVDPVLAFQVE